MKKMYVKKGTTRRICVESQAEEKEMMVSVEMNCM